MCITTSTIRLQHSFITSKYFLVLSLCSLSPSSRIFLKFLCRVVCQRMHIPKSSLLARCILSCPPILVVCSYVQYFFLRMLCNWQISVKLNGIGLCMIIWSRHRLWRTLAGVVLQIAGTELLESSNSPRQEPTVWDRWDLYPGNRNGKRTSQAGEVPEQSTQERKCVTQVKIAGSSVWIVGKACGGDSRKLDSKVMSEYGFYIVDCGGRLTYFWAGERFDLKCAFRRIITEDKPGFGEKTTWDIHKKIPVILELPLICSSVRKSWALVSESSV